MFPLIGALIGGVTSLIGAGTEAKAAQTAADAQAKAAGDNKKLAQKTTTASLADLDKSLTDALGTYDKGAADASAPLNPYAAAGEQSLSQIMNLLGLNGPDATSGALSKFVTSADYNFRVSEGQKALERSQNAGGQRFSGAAGKALVDYGQQAGSQEYGNYFDRLTGVATRGQNAATNLSDIAGNAAQSKAGAMLGTGQNKANTRLGGLNAVTGANTAMGDARASGAVGTANAWNSGLTNLSTLADKYLGSRSVLSSSGAGIY